MNKVDSCFEIIFLYQAGIWKENVASSFLRFLSLSHLIGIQKLNEILLSLLMEFRVCGSLNEIPLIKQQRSFCSTFENPAFTAFQTVTCIDSVFVTWPMVFMELEGDDGPSCHESLQFLEVWFCFFELKSLPSLRYILSKTENPDYSYLGINVANPLDELTIAFLHLHLDIIIWHHWSFESSQESYQITIEENWRPDQQLTRYEFGQRRVRQHKISFGKSICIQALIFLEIYCEIYHKQAMGNEGGHSFDPSRLSQEERMKFEQGKPLQPKPGVKITKNPITGKLEGVPEQWTKNWDLNMNIDMNKTVKTKHLSKEVRPDEDFPPSIIDLINSQPVFISKPQNFKHEMHLQVDLNSPCGIKGLTPDMMKLFTKNDISKEFIKENPEVMIQIVNGLEKKEEIPDNALLTDNEFNEQIKRIQFLPDNPNETYRFAKQLGKGAMCTVYQAFNRKNPDDCWAVRVMKVPEQEILHKIKIQAAVMSMCANKNIVNYKSSYYYMNCLFMLIEFMDGGCLTEVIYQYMKKIPERIAAYIMHEILQGLLVLHQHKQIHRDLKSDNILVGKDGSIKVADFGFAIQLTKEQKNRKSVVGTPAWMAPQLIKKENYNELVDVWSVGVIAVQLAEGEPPFLRLPPLKAMYFISTKDAHRLKKTNFSPQYCDFVEKCLQKNVSKRWSIKQLLSHPFIKKIGNGDKERQEFSEMVKNKKDVSLSELMAQSG